VDDSRTLGPIHDDQLEQVPRPVRADDEVSDRVVGDLLHDRGVTHGVIHVGVVDPMLSSRGHHVHTPVSYYENQAPRTRAQIGTRSLAPAIGLATYSAIARGRRTACSKLSEAQITGTTSRMMLYNSLSMLYNEIVTTMNVSEAREKLAEAIDAAQSEAVVLERYGRPAAVLVSMERYEQLLDALEEAEDISAFDAAMAEKGDNIPWEQVKADLGWS
jgi:antitoxin Phd